MEIQLNIFDCDEGVRSDDCLSSRLKALRNDCEIDVGNLKVKKSGRLYVVEKGAEFEEVFGDIEYCYEFINRYSSKELWEGS